MSLWEKLRGTTETIFQIALGGPQVKNNAGAIEGRNATDSAFAVVRGGTPVASNDLTTKAYVDAAGNPLTKTLDANNHAITNVRTLTFNGELDNGNSGGAATIDWTAAQKQKLTVTGAPAVLTFTNPPGACNILLKLVQGAGGSKTITWPLSVKWPAGVAPVLSTVAASIDIVSLYFDGTNYFGTFSLGFA